MLVFILLTFLAVSLIEYKNHGLEDPPNHLKTTYSSQVGSVHSTGWRYNTVDLLVDTWKAVKKNHVGRVPVPRYPYGYILYNSIHGVGIV